MDRVGVRTQGGANPDRPADDAAQAAFNVSELTPEPPIFTLPSEVLVHVFSYLDFRSVVNLQLVCRHWCELARNNALWRVLYARMFPHGYLEWQKHNEPIEQLRSISPPPSSSASDTLPSRPAETPVSGERRMTSVEEEESRMDVLAEVASLIEHTPNRERSTATADSLAFRGEFALFHPLVVIEERTQKIVGYTYAPLTSTSKNATISLDSSQEKSWKERFLRDYLKRTCNLMPSVTTSWLPNPHARDPLDDMWQQITDLDHLFSIAGRYYKSCIANFQIYPPATLYWAKKSFEAHNSFEVDISRDPPNLIASLEACIADSARILAHTIRILGYHRSAQEIVYTGYARAHQSVVCPYRHVLQLLQEGILASISLHDLDRARDFAKLRDSTADVLFGIGNYLPSVMKECADLWMEEIRAQIAEELWIFLQSVVFGVVKRCTLLMLLPNVSREGEVVLDKFLWELTLTLAHELPVSVYNEMVIQAHQYMQALPPRERRLFKPLFHQHYHPANDPDSRFPVPLCNAVQEANPAVLKRLLAESSFDDHPLVPFIFAVQRGLLPQVRLLLEHGWDVDASLAPGATALHVLAANSTCRNQMLIAEELMKYHPNVNARDARNLTPLHTSANQGNRDFVLLLVEHEGDLTAQDDMGHLPIDMWPSASSNFVKRLANLTISQLVRATIPVQHLLDTPALREELTGEERQSFQPAARAAGLLARSLVSVDPLALLNLRHYHPAESDPRKFNAFQYADLAHALLLEPDPVVCEVLADCLWRGQFVEQNIHRAVDLWRTSAEPPHLRVEAQLCMTVAYLSGVPALDHEKAFQYAKMASEQGYRVPMQLYHQAVSQVHSES